MRNFSAIRKVLLYAMLLNLVAMAVKLVAGFLTGSLSIIADGFDSLVASCPERPVRECHLPVAGPTEWVCARARV